jgi:hypothetical protein
VIDANGDGGDVDSTQPDGSTARDGSKTRTTSSPFKPVMGGGGRKRRPFHLAPPQRILIGGVTHRRATGPWRPPADPETAAPLDSRVSQSPAIASPREGERAEWLGGARRAAHWCVRAVPCTFSFATACNRHQHDPRIVWRGDLQTDLQQTERRVVSRS